jgi:hypothetical protein
MSRTVLFAGGPLHGTTMTVEDHARVVHAMEPAEISLVETIGPFGPIPRQVAYNMSRFAMCGRIIWVGHLGTEPDEDLAFEVLTSDGAKAASNVYEATAHP